MTRCQWGNCRKPATWITLAGCLEYHITRKNLCDQHTTNHKQYIQRGITQCRYQNCNLLIKETVTQPM